MTEPGSIIPPSPGWWVRKERIGIGETELDFTTSATGLKPIIRYLRKPMIPNPKVGPQALRHNFRRKPQAIPRVNKVFFDSRGAGASTGSTASIDLNFTHTLSSDANYIVLFVTMWYWYQNSASMSANINGVNMPSLASYNYNGGTTLGYLNAYALANPPTGTQTVHFVYSGSYGADIKACSVAYKNVGSAGSAVTAGGSGTTASHTVTSSLAGNMIAHAFTNSDYPTTGSTFTSYSQEARYNSPAATNAAFPLLVGDANGNASVTFSATQNSSNWGSVAIPLKQP